MYRWLAGETLALINNPLPTLIQPPPPQYLTLLIISTGELNELLTARLLEFVPVETAQWWFTGLNCSPIDTPSSPTTTSTTKATLGK